MIEDSFVKEVRAARDAYAKLFDYNLHAMIADLRARDDFGDWPVVRVAPRRPAGFNPQRKALDEQIASEPPLAPPDLPANALATPLEVQLAARHRPLAVAGIVENGLVRLLDPGVKLPEHSRVIIVASER